MYKEIKKNNGKKINIDIPIELIEAYFRLISEIIIIVKVRKNKKIFKKL